MSAPDTAVTCRSHRWLVLSVVLVAAVMDLLDSTVMNVAAPTVRAELGGGEATVQWLTAGYTLAFGILLVIGGRLGDRWGRRRLFLIGAIGFTLASVAWEVGSASGTLNAAQQIATALGVAVLGTVYFTATDPRAGLVAGALIVAASCVFCAALVLLPPRRHRLTCSIPGRNPS